MSLFDMLWGRTLTGAGALLPELSGDGKAVINVDCAARIARTATGVNMVDGKYRLAEECKGEEARAGSDMYLLREEEEACQ